MPGESGRMLIWPLKMQGLPGPWGRCWILVDMHSLCSYSIAVHCQQISREKYSCPPPRAGSATTWTSCVCKRQTWYHSARKTQVTEKMFKLTLIHPEGTTNISDIFEDIQSFRFSIQYNGGLWAHNDIHVYHFCPHMSMHIFIELDEFNELSNTF